MNDLLPATGERLRALPGVTVLENEPLSVHTSFGIGGPADLLVVPHNAEALLAAQRVLSEASLAPTFLGNGTNVLISDAGLRGVVIKVAGGLLGITLNGKATIIAAAGESLQAVCHTAAEAGLAGLEFAGGIPGTVGGAVIMNAGAHGGEMAEVVDWVEVGRRGELLRLTREDLSFGYRDSLVHGGTDAVMRVGLRLTPDTREGAHLRICEILQRRCAKQPVTRRSAGCVFKRPRGDYAGRLVEAAGAKGLRIGDAAISTKHANFIVNLGHARARDVLELIDTVRDRVYEEFGVELETEIIMLGDFTEC